MDKAELYKRNQKIRKVLRVASPIVYWVFMALAMICLIFAIRNSIGNLLEMYEMLDGSDKTGQELVNNYDALLDKYGPWSAQAGPYVITFIDVRNVVLNGFAITNAIFAVFFYIAGNVLGKWVFPWLARKIEKDNQDMVNITILENNK
jgi:phage-related minor tail protein